MENIENNDVAAVKIAIRERPCFVKNALLEQNAEDKIFLEYSPTRKVYSIIFH